MFPGGQVRELWNLPHVPENSGLDATASSDPAEQKLLAPAGEPGAQPIEQMEETVAPQPDQTAAPVVNEPVELIPVSPQQTTRMQTDPSPLDTQNEMPEEFDPYEAEIEAAAAEYHAAQERKRAARQRELAAGRPSREERAESAQLVRFPLDTTTATLAAFAQSTVQASASLPPPDSGRHSRRCLVCSHPDRDAIEGEFIRWRSPSRIADDYGLADRASIYRHAHATGLLQRRRREASRILEHVLERAESTPTEEFDVLTRALRLYTHLDDESRWRAPIRTHHILHGQIGAQPPIPLDESGEVGSLPDALPASPLE